MKNVIRQRKGQYFFSAARFVEKTFEKKKKPHRPDKTPQRG